MVQTGAEKGCCGNFARAVPGVTENPDLQCFADCCKTCPPDCCDTLYFYFECGDPQEGECCEGAGFLDPNLFPTTSEETEYYYPGEELDELPDFYHEDGTIVRALGFGPGSCPCEQIKVTLTTTYCCLILEGASAAHVGDGQVSATVDPESASNGCGTYRAEISVNGGAWQSSPVSVQDDDSIQVRVVAEDGDCDCYCCYLSSEDPCNYGAEMFAAQSVSGGLKLVVNRDAVLRRYHSIQQAHAINAFRNWKKDKKNKSVKRTAPIKQKKPKRLF